ncbi:MAG: hypothetical protein FWH29_07115 [Methanobrevibacter sp.]|nr:hypothetical protein [Methanobrevibacter sp.]
MTSFLNKKFSLILVILATLLIAISITSVSASTVTLEYNDGNISKDYNLSDNVDVIINGTVTGDAPATGTDLPVNGTVFLMVQNATSNWVIIDQINITGVESSVNVPYNFTFNLNQLKILGANNLTVEFVSDDIPEQSNGTSTQIDAILMGNITIVWESEPVNLVVGQEGNITGIVYGQNPDNIEDVIPLQGITLEITLPDGTTFTATTVSWGGFILAPINAIPNLKFNIAASFSGANNSNTTLDGLYRADNDTHVFNAGVGKINPVVWWDSPNGYLVGNNSTIFWNITGEGAGDLTGTNILAWLVLFDYDKPNVELRRAVVDLASNITVGNMTACGHFNLSAFILPHERLYARLVIDGRDLNTPNFERIYESSNGDAETFVYTENAKPVKVTLLNFVNTTVGHEETFLINVTSRLDGSPIESGQLNITWDGKYSFIVPVLNGTATFTHTFSLAGENRFVEVRYLANPGLQLGASAKASANLAVFKGTPTLTVTQLPDPSSAFVGAPVTIEVMFNLFAAGATNAPRNITLKFVEAGNVVHSVVVDIIPNPAKVVNDIEIHDNIAFARFEYTYKEIHALLTLLAELNDGVNYNNVTGSTTVTVV